MKPLISIADAATGDVEVREMTDDEFAAYEADQARRELEEAERQAAKQAREVARQAILDRLGLTEDEAKILLS
jgi:hypothetical protein